MAKSEDRERERERETIDGGIIRQKQTEHDLVRPDLITVELTGWLSVTDINQNNQQLLPPSHITHRPQPTDSPTELNPYYFSRAKKSNPISCVSRYARIPEAK